MANVCRSLIDTAGGLILGSSSVRIDGYPVALVGSLVLTHPPAPDEPSHAAAIIVNGSSRFIVDGRAVCLSGISRASCGHSATSRSSVRAI
jgi:uncharacterized Zn-binding protein involved in type VI secretion